MTCPDHDLALLPLSQLLQIDSSQMTVDYDMPFLDLLFHVKLYYQNTAFQSGTISLGISGDLELVVCDCQIYFISFPFICILTWLDFSFHFFSFLFFSFIFFYFILSGMELVVCYLQIYSYANYSMDNLK